MVRVTEIGSAHAAIRSGIGLGVLSCITGDADRGDIVRLSDPTPELTDKLHLLIHRDVLREPAVKSATDALAKVFKRHRPVLPGEATEKMRVRAA